MTPSSILSATYVQHLHLLANWLTKARDQLGDAAAQDLLVSRIAPDMFPLATQVRFVCAQALEGTYRLREMEFPALVGEMLKEGQNAGDAPGTIDSALARIEQTITVVEKLLNPAKVDAPDRPVAHSLPIGIVFDVTLEQYVRDWALPQFYFHLVTAYAIMRGQGVELGKADFVAHMFAHVRPGTLPANMG
ncbi:DUF1993 family protein [Croceicoccus naphthovorans]|uniref:DUF1993 domain-containing protein n=1 Tax=Croceicoccus naphthovorans TaxID=1348774 RepID=A0A0G3XMT0_9SPHN|nr:DUF1993 domain-containing protein [Croceicoccus naphthovorans]AKM11956.1 hypothetical protein AB433_16950 [Croceicoccus naphthovorans]